MTDIIQAVSADKKMKRRIVNKFTHPECVAESVEQVVVGLHFIPVQLPAGGGADHQRQAV